MLCGQCEALVINGILCHERNCPEAWKDCVRKCEWCNQDFKPDHRDQTCCCEDCLEAYHG